MGDGLVGDIPLIGPRAWLRPVKSTDYPFLFELGTAGTALTRWRYRGVTPSPEAFAQSLWQGVLTQFLILSRSTNQPIGLVLAYNANHAQGRAYFAVQSRQDMLGSGLALEGCFIFLNFLFENWPFRKLYLEALDINFEQFASAVDRYIHIEGRLTEWEYYQGRYHDNIIASIRREEWPATLSRVLPTFETTIREH
jgi:RimJ/RimL family protein N-acetyltransferase